MLLTRRRRVEALGQARLEIAGSGGRLSYWDALRGRVVRGNPRRKSVLRSPTLAEIVEEGELVEAELKKRKLINDELEKQVARTKDIYADHKQICATMRAEIPVIQTQAQTDLQAVRDVVVQYDETVKELLMKKWRLDEVQRDEAPPFAKADAQPIPLKLDALDLRAPTDAAIKAEIPIIQKTVKTAINFSGFSQCVCSLIVSYAPRALPHTYAPCRAVGRDPQGSRGDAPT